MHFHIKDRGSLGSLNLRSFLIPSHLHSAYITYVDVHNTCVFSLHFHFFPLPPSHNILQNIPLDADKKTFPPESWNRMTMYANTIKVVTIALIFAKPPTNWKMSNGWELTNLNLFAGCTLWWAYGSAGSGFFGTAWGLGIGQSSPAA